MRHTEMLDRFITFVGLNRTPATQEYYRNKLGPMFKEWDSIDPAQWTRPRFEAFLAKGKLKGWSARQIGMTLTACRQPIAYRKDIGEPIPDVVGSIKAPKVIISKVDFYTAEDVRLLLATARDAGQARWELFIGLAAHAGARRSEVFRAPRRGPPRRVARPRVSHDNPKRRSDERTSNYARQERPRPPRPDQRRGHEPAREVRRSPGQV